MTNVIVISGTTREGRKSHQVANYLVEELNKKENVAVDLLDVKALNFPLMEYKFNQHPNPTAEMKKAQTVLENANGIIIVSPEYNGDMPGALKNTLDYFYEEYKDKAFGISTVSSGDRGGVRVGLNLRQQALNYNGIVLPRMLAVPNVGDKFDENNKLKDEQWGKDADSFLDKFLWLTRALLK